MSKKKRTRSTGQTLFWLMSLVIVLSMVISLFIVALPGPPEPTPAPLPTWTPRPRPSPTLEPSPSPSPTLTATLPVVGPDLPPPTETSTPALELAPPLQPTATPTSEARATPTLEPTATPAALTFAVAGDSRSNPSVYRRVLAAVMASGSEFLIHTGDLVNEGTEEEWQVFRQAMDGFTLPFYPVPGNHDGLDGELDGYLAHSGAPAAHYSFDRGPVHFTLADTHHGGVTAAELAWLRQDLSQTSQPLKIVVMHHPPFDPDGSDHIMAFGNEAVMDLLAEMDVDHVFVGHIHAFVQGERDGVKYTITGGAGAPLYAADHPVAVHHFLKVTVRDDVTIDMIELPPPT